MTSHHRTLGSAVALATALLGLGLPVLSKAATFPPLNNPASTETHPGKFVWAELFTDDPVAATKYYTGVFGWTAITIEQRGVTYVVFSNGAHPIAGLRQRSASAAKRAARWINYVSVGDIASTLALATQAGGEVQAPARKFPKIGLQAIITDKGGSPVGLLQSSSGDSPDSEPTSGDWNWFHLLASDPRGSADFYKQVLKYDVSPDSREGKSAEWLLSSGAFNRAGVSAVPDGDTTKSGWLGIVRVADLDGTLARVPALGGEVIVAPHEATLGSRFALIADPTGGTLGVVEYVNNANPANRP